uniref:Uncharacterized protein n=1 Tax=Octopus bimaculoides TaxID=37653 RepID=A0A0L8H766_OCTBM
MHQSTIGLKFHKTKGYRTLAKAFTHKCLKQVFHYIFHIHISTRHILTKRCVIVTIDLVTFSVKFYDEN